MKKIIALIIASVMVLSFAACGAKDVVDNVVNDVVDNIVEEANKEITRGVINGNSYTSEYSGISFNKPDAWTYSSDEELAALISASAEQLDTTNFAKSVAEMGSVYDMMATDPATGSNVMVLYENLKITNAGNSLTAKEYLDILKTQLPTQSGMDYNFMSEETVTFNGNEYLKGTFTLTIETSIISQVYYMRAIGDVMNVVIVTPVNGVTPADVEAMFA